MRIRAMLFALAVSVALTACGDDAVSSRSAVHVHSQSGQTSSSSWTTTSRAEAIMPSRSSQRPMYEAGVERTYDIRGDNVGHTHTVTVTADRLPFRSELR